MKAIIGTLGLFSAATLLTACATEPDQRRTIGLIDTLPAAGALQIPDTVSLRSVTQATVTTWGSACRTPDGASVRGSANAVDITPYDLAPPPGTTCIMVVKAFPRSVEIRWQQLGPATVRLHGRSGAGPVTVEHQVLVLP